ncbi:MAG: hypothetical protein QOH31_3628, partial [Verrucomicrobiota bacterium]
HRRKCCGANRAANYCGCFVSRRRPKELWNLRKESSPDDISGQGTEKRLVAVAGSAFAEATSGQWLKSGRGRNRTLEHGLPGASYSSAPQPRHMIPEALLVHLSPTGR